MYKAVIGFFSAVALMGGLLTATVAPSLQTTMHRSCGYHCTEDGSAVTPAAPPVIRAQPVRTNIHSDGRAAGKALPRRSSPTQRGIGKYGIHKVDLAAPTIEIQLVRNNIHSGGRLHGSANKRVGCGGCKGHPA